MAAIVETTFQASGPPQVAWEFLTTPGRRLNWSVGITDLVVEAPGNRRGVGTTNHCVHGPMAIIEEVADWRPYDYYTIRTTMPTPGGPARFLMTVELEPASDGTIVTMRFGSEKAGRELATLRELRPMLEQVTAEGARVMREQLEAELEAARLASGPEPDIPAPRPGGVLSEGWVSV